MANLEYYISLLPLRLITWPKTCFLLILIVSSYLVFVMDPVRFDSTLEGFLSKDNPQSQAYYDFKDSYGESEYFILLIRSKNIFTPVFDQKLTALANDIIENVPFISGVETIANSRYIKSHDDVVQIGALFDNLETSASDIFFDATTNPYYVHRLINEAGDVTAVIIKLKALVESTEKGKMASLKLEQTKASLNELRSIVERHQEDFSEPLLIGGAPMAMVELTKKTQQDILIFSLSSVLLVSLALMFFFKRFSAVFLPLISLFLAVIITMSLMIIMQYPIQVTSSILPSFLMAVCVGDSVHFLKAFYRAYDKGKSKDTAVRYAIRSTSVAMFFTTLMTSVGLLSFAHSQIVPIASFGLFSALGVWVALLLTLVILPSLILIVPVTRRSNTAVIASHSVLLKNYVNFIRHYALAIVIASVMLMCVCILLSTQLRVSHDPLTWLKTDNETRRIVEAVDRDLTGTMQLELLVESKSGPLSVEQLHQLDDWLSHLSGHLDSNMPIRSTNSIIDLLKQMNQVFQPEKGLSLPADPALLAQQILLLQLNAAEDIDQLCNMDCSEIRVTLTTPWKDAVYYSEFLTSIEQAFVDTFSPELSLRMTGMASIVNRTFTELLSSMLVSYIISATVISLLMVLVMRSLRLGLAMMLPNLLPVFSVLAIMYLFSMPLDLFSMLMGSIAIGLIVDDSIHLISAFQRYRKQNETVETALIKTLQNTGLALLITTLVLCAGFLTYTFSDLQNLVNFGILTSLCIAFALLADLLIAPAILVLLYDRQHAKKPLLSLP